MKKIIAGLSALALAAAIAPVSGFAEPAPNPDPQTGLWTITPDPENMPAPKPGTTNTTVQFGVDPTYTVTIPATVDLTVDTTTGKYSGSGTITASNVTLEENKVIAVSLTSASNFNMKTSLPSASYQLPYTAEGAFGKLTDKANGGIVAKFTTPDNDTTDPQTSEVTFTTDEAPKYAGSYSDPVVFTIAIEDEGGN